MSPAKIVNVDNLLGRRGTNVYAFELERWQPFGAEVVITQTKTEDDLIAACRGANIVVYEGTMTPFTRRVIEQLKDCWMIARYGIGMDSVDMAAATEHGIIVANAADYCVEEVAEHAIALLLACARRVFEFDRHIQAGGYGLALKYPMRRLRTLTLGSVAFGRIPRAMARKLRGFEMRILATDPYIPTELPREYGVELVSLEQVLRESDLVSVHTPLTPETRGLIGEAQLRLMKPSAYIINTARGPVIDEAALVRVLQEGRIAGAALDVTAVEPLPADSPLRGMPNVILTPHHAALSVEALQDLHRRVGTMVAAVLQGHWPPFVMNPEVKPRLALKPYAELEQ